MSIAICIALLLGSSFQAQAWDVTAKVITIEPSYMPDVVLFKLDAAADTCTAGNWLYYYGTAYNTTDSKKNVQAIYIGLLTTLDSGKRLEVHGDTNCVAINIHPTNQ
jgi:hypothetical protein